ncbi:MULTISPECIES: nucleotide exchange factor GrpE [unclassified Duganella]|jgi:molecular chaperone GrpE|uniref:nucleotide exchange factor GrpE n=1 Tax=unclassified Duganella TaxID=2636909 RepID=UPI00088D2ECB|nr:MULTISPECIES: nucleotide exchange factor GrpE [unclassified Duganella]SDG19921.1 molecular chaperone GrpE [Duganella sp. OV458]SDJ28293.1 molecular chaperone GrpE [Duganella sp. OV510]
MQDQENQAVPPNPEAAEAAASAPPSTPEAGQLTLEEQLAATEAKLADMHDAFMRAKADGENIRRRAQEDVAKAHKFAVESFAEAMVPVKDSLEMALKVEAPTVESLKEGVEMTLKQLSSAFERNRLIAIEPAQGEKLDPNKHQAVAVVPAEQEANTVVSVLQKGYMIADRLLRPAIVTAAQAK